jgi:hypothetical protein
MRPTSRTRRGTVFRISHGYREWYTDDPNKISSVGLAKTRQSSKNESVLEFGVLVGCPALYKMHSLQIFNRFSQPKWHTWSWRSPSPLDAWASWVVPHFPCHVPVSCILQPEKESLHGKLQRLSSAMTEPLVERIPFDVWMPILEQALDSDYVLGPSCLSSDIGHLHPSVPRDPAEGYTHKWLSLALVCKTWLFYLRPYANLVVQIDRLGQSPHTGHREPVLRPSFKCLSQGILNDIRVMYYEPVLSLLRHEDLFRCLTWTPKLRTLVLVGQRAFSARIPICSMLRYCTPLLSLRRLEVENAELVPYCVTGRSPECDLFETIVRLFPNLRRLSIISCILQLSATRDFRLSELESLTLLGTARFDYQIPTWDLPSLRCLEFGASMSSRRHSVMHELSVLRQVVQDLGKRLCHLSLSLIYSPQNTLLCEVDWIRDLPELRSLFVEFTDPKSATPLAAIPPDHPLSRIWVLDRMSGFNIPELLRIPSKIHRTVCVFQIEFRSTRLFVIEKELVKKGVHNVTVKHWAMKNNEQALAL